MLSGGSPSSTKVEKETRFSCKDGKVVPLPISASTVIVKVNDIDETAALSDGDVQLMIIGHDIVDNY